MMTDLNDVLDLLQSAHETVEGMAFSPDSGVSSCSDSEPSSPVLCPLRYTVLNNADLLAFPDKEGSGSLCPDNWLPAPCSGFQMYSGYGGDHSHPQPQTLHSQTISHDCMAVTEDHTHWAEAPTEQVQLPTCVSEHILPSPPPASIKEEWVETKTGFQVCHTDNTNAKVKLGGGLTYDIDIAADIQIPGAFPTVVVKAEMVPDSTTRQYEDNNYTYQQDKNNCDNYENNCDNSFYRPNYGMVVYSYQNSNTNAHAETLEDRLPVRRRPSATRTERLWEFTLRLLGDPNYNPELIEWVDREDGTFRLNNSRAIAHMWGMRKNNVHMTYEKLSRALRYYYHRHILEPVLGKKLVYRFGPNASQVWEGRVYRPQASR